MADQFRMRRLDYAAIAALLLTTLAFGVLVQWRSVHLSTRKTDVGVYLRAGWAARTGADIYTAVDDNGWHYSYPPLLSILMIPFADAPRGVEQPAFAVPYVVSVALCYIVGVFCLFWAVHMMATVLEETGWPGYLASYPRFSRPWWGLRFWPVIICLPGIGSSLSRGQVNTVVLLAIAGFAADTIRGRRGRAGLWLAMGVCLKVFPIFLAVIPLVRRDLRTLAFGSLGLFVGLAVIPVATLGPDRALSTGQTFLSQTILPGFGLPGNGTLARDLTDLNCTDNQSTQGIVHNLRHWSEDPRPATADKTTKFFLVGAAAFLTLATFAARPRRADRPLAVLFLVGNLAVVMVLICPVSHHHYFCLAVPLALALVADSMQRRESARLGVGLGILVGLQILLATLPKMPGLEVLRDAGVTMEGALGLWVAGVMAMRRLSDGRAEQARKPMPTDWRIFNPVHRKAA